MKPQRAITPVPVPTPIRVRILSPNGNEKIKVGSTIGIRWSAVGGREPVNVELTMRGRTIAVIARNVGLAKGGMQWKVLERALPGLRYGDGYKIVLKTTRGQVLDSSDGTFSIVAAKQVRPPVASPGTTSTGSSTGTAGTTTPDASDPGTSEPATPSIAIQQPAANDRWCTNDSHEIRWSSSQLGGQNIKIDLMRSNGQVVWQSVTASTSDTGSFTWPGLSDAQFVSGSITLRPRISTVDDSVVAMGDYLHFGKRLVLSKPQSNYTWRKGSQYAIVWYQKCDLPSAVTVELLDGAQQVVDVLATGLTPTGATGGKTLQWTVPNTLSPGTYYIRVRSSGNEYSKQTSFTVDEPVFIQTSPALSFTSPTANDVWCTNDSHNFTWSSNLGAGTNVKIDLMRSNGQTVWQQVTASTPNDGSHTWPGLSDAQFVSGSITLRPRISTLDNAEITVGDYLHFGKRLMLDKPKSNYTWRKGSQYTIVWQQMCTLPSPLQIELLDSSHQLVSTIASGLSTSGGSTNKTRSWSVPTNLTPGTYYMRVRTSGGEYTSESSFTIDEPLQF